MKAYSWERSFLRHVAAARKSESASILISQTMKAVSLALYVVTPALASMALFLVYVLQGNALSVDVIQMRAGLVAALSLPASAMHVIGGVVYLFFIAPSCCRI